MNSSDRNYLLFKTDLFITIQPDDQIDRWRVGGDCAGWFHARLLLFPSVEHDCDPMMEDWGWPFSVLVEGVRVNVNVWEYAKFDNCWLFGVEIQEGFFFRKSAEAKQRARKIVCDALESIIDSDSRFTKHAWYSENLWEHEPVDF